MKQGYGGNKIYESTPWTEFRTHDHIFQILDLSGITDLSEIERFYKIRQQNTRFY